MQAETSLLSRALALPSVPFTQRTRRLPERPGLYFAILDDTEVLYIGIARKSLRQRWKTWHSVTVHAGKHDMAERIRIGYVLYDDIERLKADEKSAIRQFQPALNFNFVPNANERHQRIAAESCEWIDCSEHWHHRWQPLKPPTKTRPCVCIVHESCETREIAREAKRLAG